MQVTWSSRLHTPVAVTIEHTASVTRSFEFFQNKSQLWVLFFFFFLFVFNIHSLLTFKCYPSPPKEHCVKQIENFGKIRKAGVWVSKLKAMGRGRGRGQGIPVPLAHSSLSACGRSLYLGLQSWTQSAPSCLLSECISPQSPHCSFRPSPNGPSHYPSNTPNSTPPSTVRAQCLLFPPHSYVEATTPHAMILGHGVFGRLLGVDEVMRVVPPGGNVCP